MALQSVNQNRTPQFSRPGKLVVQCGMYVATQAKQKRVTHSLRRKTRATEELEKNSHRKQVQYKEQCKQEDDYQAEKFVRNCEFIDSINTLFNNIFWTFSSKELKFSRWIQCLLDSDTKYLKGNQEQKEEHVKKILGVLNPMKSCNNHVYEWRLHASVEYYFRNDSIYPRKKTYDNLIYTGFDNLMAEISTIEGITVECRFQKSTSRFFELPKHSDPQTKFDKFQFINSNSSTSNEDVALLAVTDQNNVECSRQYKRRNNYWEIVDLEQNDLKHMNSNLQNSFKVIQLLAQIIGVIILAPFMMLWSGCKPQVEDCENTFRCFYCAEKKEDIVLFYDEDGKASSGYPRGCC